MYVYIFLNIDNLCSVVALFKSLYSNSSVVHCAKYMLLNVITWCTQVNSIIKGYNYVSVFRTC
jgi:hypothetical protein